MNLHRTTVVSKELHLDQRDVRVLMFVIVHLGVLYAPLYRSMYGGVR